jgi:hypothetical protein
MTALRPMKITIRKKLILGMLKVWPEAKVLQVPS